MSVAAVLLVGALLSAALALWVRQTLAQAEATQFERLALRVEREVVDRFERTTYGLKGVRASFVADEHMGLGMDRAQFRSWVKAHDIDQDFPGVRGFGLIQPVERRNLQRFIAAERADGAPGFDLRQLADLGHETSYVVRFIEPVERNAAALGLDVGSEPRRRRAIERAIDSASITITEPIPLVQDGRQTPGFLVCVPLYRAPAAMAVPGLRRASVSGIVYAPVVARELLADVTGVSDHRIDVELFAGPADVAGRPENLVFDSDSSRSAEGAQAQERRHRLVRGVEILGSPFTLELKASAGFDAGNGAWQAWMALLAGLSVTGLLAWLVLQKSTQQARAKAYAASMTADLERLALVARRTSNAVIITDRQLRIEWVNEAFTRLYGYSAEQAVGRVPGDLLATQRTSADAVAVLQGAAEAGTGCRVEVINLTAQGSEIWIDTEVQPRLDAEGRVNGFVEIQSDITARRQAEAAARRSGELLRNAIEAIDEAFVMYDADDRLVMCNERYRQVYAYSADLIVPGARFEDIIRHGAQRGQYAEAIGRVEEWVAERMAIHIACSTARIQRLQDGRILRIVERRLEDGHIVGFRVDVTELERARLQAEEASRAKSQFLANVSHEIRTPMNAILGMLELLRRTRLDPRQLDYATKTEGAARSLLGLLNDVLDFSKAEAGKLTLDPQPFSLQALLADLSVIYAASVRGKAVEVLFDVGPDVPDALVGDVMRLQQVLINLGGNAIKFTSQGEVVLSVGLQRLEGGTARLAFAVRDTGIGIAQENLERIFSGFTQAEASTTRRFGGTGLGVAISQRIVALMGGELQVHSELGKGSVFDFMIELPVAAGSQAAAADPVPAASDPTHVLIVDDHPLARGVLLRAARSLGWRVDEAVDAGNALEAFDAAARRGDPYGAVFVDWVMPGMDGWELVQALRAREAQAQGGRVRLVMVTAHGREGLHSRAAQEQALIDGFLVKPVTAGMLADALKLSGAAAARAAEPRGARPRPLAGLRLLVAEDNLNNQQVVRELLEDEGASVVLVAHGGEAVQAIATAPERYDLVLMDLQMPVMDGLEATRTIRTRLDRHDLPIVAMTANALASDRAACLEAGMNDHVGKPFDLHHVVGVILAQLGRSVTEPAPRAAAAATPDATPDAALEAAASRAGVDLHAALERMGGRRAAYRRMLEGFLDELGGLPATLRRAQSAADAEALRHSLHSARGVAATLGADRLAQALAIAESRLGEGAVEAELAVVVAAVAAARPGLESLLTALDTPAPRPVAGTAPMRQVSVDELQRRIGSLVDLLNDSDLAAIEAVADLQQCFGGAAPDWLADIEQAVDRMDFDDALRRCDEALRRTQAVPG